MTDETQAAVAPETFDQKLKASLETIWKERDDFIRWTALFAVWAMYFSINLMVDNRKAAQPFFSPQGIRLLEWSSVCFFISIAAAVIYKWRWSVKYVFEELELEYEHAKWEEENAALLKDSKLKPSSFEGISEPGFFDSKRYVAMKTAMKVRIRINEWLYKISLGFFVLAFIPQFLALFLFLHPK